MLVHKLLCWILAQVCVCVRAYVRVRVIMIWCRCLCDYDIGIGVCLCLCMIQVLLVQVIFTRCEWVSECVCVCVCVCIQVLLIQVIIAWTSGPESVASILKSTLYTDFYIIIVPRHWLLRIFFPVSAEEGDAGAASGGVSFRKSDGNVTGPARSSPTGLSRITRTSTS